MPQTTLVIPCFNEEKRLQDEPLLALARAPGLRLLMVDDGSRDGTRGRLEALAARAPDTIAVLALPRNGGKAEAIRAGMLQALADGAAVVGFADADLSTPAPELQRLVAEIARRPEQQVVMGSRVRRLGAAIQRRAARHVLGRIFATGASLALRLPVYDTQCGAKLFRDTPVLRAALAQPFETRWAFDVELLARLTRRPGGYRAEDIVEIPLLAWADVGGSKLRAGAAACAALDLCRIAWRQRRATKGPREDMENEEQEERDPSSSAASGIRPKAPHIQ